MGVLDISLKWTASNSFSRDSDSRQMEWTVYHSVLSTGATVTPRSLHVSTAGRRCDSVSYVVKRCAAIAVDSIYNSTYRFKRLLGAGGGQPDIKDVQYCSGNFTSGWSSFIYCESGRTLQSSSGRLQVPASQPYLPLCSWRRVLHRGWTRTTQKKRYNRQHALPAVG